MPCPPAAFGVAACIACALALAACGSTAGPTSPSTPAGVDLDFTQNPLVLVAEPYLLQLTGGDATYDGTAGPCSPSGVPAVGKWVTTYLWFTPEGHEWIGRSREPFKSSLTMRLRRVSSSILGVVVEGTLDGSAADEFDPVLGKLDLVFDVERTGLVQGMLSPVGGANRGGLGGTVRGAFSFAGGNFEVATCSSVQFYLEPRSSQVASSRLELEP